LLKDDEAHFFVYLQREYPIIKIYADLTSINRAGRYAVWTWARDALHAWDGLLSVDWIGGHMVSRIVSFFA
jgi:hypothetical protein